MTIRVLLVDDHKILLETLGMLLEGEQDIQVAGTAASGREAIACVESMQPDVVVMDISMPDLNGIDTTRRLHASHPRVRVVALSAHAQTQYVMDMLEAGASAYIIKENAAGELVRAIRAVMKGQKYLCPEVAAAVVDYTGRTPARGAPQLGLREREVLQLLSEGSTSPEIAKRLFISPSTVDVHRRNIMKKLDLHSVAELTKYAVRNGITSI